MIIRSAAHPLLALPAFFFFALIAGGCKTNINTLGSGGMDAGKFGQKDVATEDTLGAVNACSQAGGSCVAVYPGTCASGVVDSSLSCGPGVGSECCLPGGAGGSSGAGGSTETGGNNGTGGSTSAPVNACTQAGGSCVGVLPGACAPGIVNLSLSCGSGVGTECCMSGGAGGSTGAGGNTGTGGSGGSIGRDAGVDGGNLTLAELCTSTGGLVASGLCCASNSGFPEMCQGMGACSCGPTGSKTISVCDCGTGCFSQTLGCVRN